jgi:hypothetical protein
MVAQSLNLGQVLSLGKTCGSVRSPGGPQHDEVPKAPPLFGLAVIPAPNALADLVSPLLRRAIRQPVLEPADPNVLHLVAL